jgi:hypothetical protein
MEQSPLIPPKVVPWLAAIGAIAMSVQATVPEHTVGWKVASGVVSALALIGIISPGWRKK